MLTTETYLRPPFTDMAEVAAVVELWDATTANWMARCPRYGEYKILHALQPTVDQYQLQAGKAIHAFLDFIYTGLDAELAFEELRRVWGHDADWRPPTPGHQYAHLHLGHLEVIAKNYLDFKRRDTFQPLAVHRDELRLDRVLAGVWKVTDAGVVVLGESKFIMEFPLTLPNGEQVTYVHSGRPDLPISMAGGRYIFDHKTTSSYLSDWYFAQYRFSNQLRGYCAMLHELTGMTFDGALINGIYVGEKASATGFSGAKFARFGPMMYQPAHLTEALLNQYYWKQELYRCAEQQFFPQNPGRQCGSCEMADLCNAAPATRSDAMTRNYKRSPMNVMETFLSL